MLSRSENRVRGSPLALQPVQQERTKRERERENEGGKEGAGVHRVSIKESIRFGIFLCVSRIVEIVPQAGH